MPLGAFSWGSRSQMPQPRTRPEHVLIWVTEGKTRLDLPRQGMVLHQGDLRFIPAGTAFASRPQPETEGHVLLLSPELAAAADPPFPATLTAGRIGAAAAALAATLHEMADEAALDPQGKALACHLNLLSLRLSRLDARQDRQDRPPLPELASRPLVEQFLALAATQLGCCRTLAELAQDLQTTLTQLDRASLEARGRRAVDLMNELRLERAAELLRHTNSPTSRIAQDLGFATHTHFTRAFVAATGRTPDAYRAQMS